MSEVLAKATRSFLLGKDVKSARSDPFALEQSVFTRLEQAGLVARHDVTQADSQKDGATEVDDQAPVRRERKAKQLSPQ